MVGKQPSRSATRWFIIFSLVTSVSVATGFVLSYVTLVEVLGHDESIYSRIYFKLLVVDSFTTPVNICVSGVIWSLGIVGIMVAASKIIAHRRAHGLKEELTEDSEESGPVNPNK